jgi:hypothetical protein
MGLGTVAARAAVVLAALTLAACGSSGGPGGGSVSAHLGGPPAGTGSPTFTSTGDPQCTITYSVMGTNVALTVTSTVAGELSYNAVGIASGAADATRVQVGTKQLQATVTNFQRVTGTVTSDTDKSVYQCSVAPAK